MSIDARVLLRIEELAPPKTPWGTELPVAHRGDASVVSTFTKFGGHAPDELALALRAQLGAELDRHDDPRGILVFPDTCSFRGKSYDAIVAEVEPAGFWAPNVGLEHVPGRYTNAASGTHDALVGRMIARLGRDAALELDVLAQTYALMKVSGNPDAGAAEHFESVAHAMGADFAAEYAASVERAAEETARRASSFDPTSEPFARMQRGEPLVTTAELDAFVTSGGADAVFAGLDPSLLAALEKDLGALDTDALGDDDAAKVLAKALKRTRG